MSLGSTPKTNITLLKRPSVSAAEALKTASALFYSSGNLEERQDANTCRAAMERTSTLPKLTVFTTPAPTTTALSEETPQAKI